MGKIRSALLLAALGLAGGLVWWAWERGDGQSFPTQASNPAAGPQGLLPDEANTVEIAAKYGPGVVLVQSYVPGQALPRNLPPQFAPFFAPFLQPPQVGTGSGFFVDPEGHILTNYHVVQGAERIEVRLQGNPQAYPAKLVGAVPALDLALLKVDAKPPAVLPLGDSDRLLVGQKAIAIGNPFGLEFTVTTGVISAIRQNPGAVDPLVPKLIQTDAPINPGNSGGPLLNSQGEVVGVNTAILSPTGQVGAPQYSGIGFAIPINLVKEWLPAMRAGKQVSEAEILAKRPRIGVEVVPLSALPPSLRAQYGLPEQGLLVQRVTPGLPAQKAGIKGASRFVDLQDPVSGQVVQVGVDGDVLMEANGNPLTQPTDLQNLLANLKPGQAVSLKVWRQGRTFEVRVTPAGGGQ
ncbi:S1C family serine protease [Thermus thalpophilus]|uniref:S1C family serine protease n=1 Tax=Thermus thalpophilus TaxID=2908147 RepID=UPI001FA9C29F|nr:trypsin-like peptidase domain-containing protein [Thermus thalpophilus]